MTATFAQGRACPGMPGSALPADEPTGHSRHQDEYEALTNELLVLRIQHVPAHQIHKSITNLGSSAWEASRASNGINPSELRSFGMVSMKTVSNFVLRLVV